MSTKFCILFFTKYYFIILIKTVKYAIIRQKMKKSPQFFG